MATIEIELDPKLYQPSEFNVYIPATTPKIIQSTDGQLRIYLTATCTLWVMATDAPKIRAMIRDTKEFPAAPNLGISESTLLKAIALAQNPDLAMNILKKEF